LVLDKLSDKYYTYQSIQKRDCKGAPMNPWSMLGTDVVILMLLACDDAHYTGSIRDAVALQGGRVADSNISMALKRLEECRLIQQKGSLVRGQAGRPRKYFELTPKGHALAQGVCGIVRPALETLEANRLKAVS
jgi:DNA-binding PadR family transcriptional regulator